MLQEYFKSKEVEWEDLCIRCGGCCGAFDDPCKHLKKERGGSYFCNIYASRLGVRQTVGGEIFNCVPVKEIIRTYWKNDHLCSCKRTYKYGIK
jgi:hypothetical protein